MSQPWRLATAHFTHVNYWHALSNCLWLIGILALAPRRFTLVEWTIIAAFLTALINISLYLRTDNWSYSGGSSLFIGLFCVAVLSYQRAGTFFRLLTLTVLGITLHLSETPEYLSEYTGARTQHWVAYVGGIVSSLVYHITRQDIIKHD